MAKEIQGSCNRCGQCGCYEGAGGPEKWYPGIGWHHFGWGCQYPTIQMALIQIIKDEFEDKFGRPWERDDVDFEVDVRITGGGPAVEATCYVTQRGVQRAPTDASCAFCETTINATITGTTFTATTVTGSSTKGTVVDNLAKASGGSVGIVSNVEKNTLTVHSWVGGTPSGGEEVIVIDNVCKLWARQQLPPACNRYPQEFHLLPNGEELIAAWEANHPHTSAGGLCGYYWIDV